MSIDISAPRATEMATINIDLATEDDTLALGACLATVLRPGDVVYLFGELGAGKTTLARGLLRALGHSGAVKSPTYTLIEPYTLSEYTLLHCDLYRLSDPEELEYLGLDDDLPSDHRVLLIEWPQRGTGWLPAADFQLQLDYHGERRRGALIAASGAGRQRLTVALNSCILSTHQGES